MQTVKMIQEWWGIFYYGEKYDAGMSLCGSKSFLSSINPMLNAVRSSPFILREGFAEHLTPEVAAQFTGGGEVHLTSDERRQFRFEADQIQETWGELRNKLDEDTVGDRAGQSKQDIG